jgi:hypothetical protein
MLLVLRDRQEQDVVRHRLPLWLGLLIGVALTPVLLCVAFLYAIHDGFRIAAHLFPTAVLLSPDLGSLNVDAIALGLIQWPLYGLILGYSYTNHRRSLSAIILAFLIVQHLLIGNVAAARVNAFPVRMKLERDLPP